MTFINTTNLNMWSV